MVQPVEGVRLGQSARLHIVSVANWISRDTPQLEVDGGHNPYGDRRRLRRARSHIP